MRVMGVMRDMWKLSTLNSQLSECISCRRCKACERRGSGVCSVQMSIPSPSVTQQMRCDMCSQRVGFVEGFLCQTSEQLRSLLSANEEVAMRGLVQKAPTRHARYSSGASYVNSLLPPSEKRR